MHRSVRLMGCIAVILFGGFLEAHAQFTIRAAAADPVPGWQKMEAGDHSVWVSPTASLTSADIGHFQQITDRDGRTAISIFFTDGGARKMRELSVAQMNKLVAMVLDGKVIFAPRIRAEITKDALITGNGPNGLTPEDVKGLLTALSRK